MMMSVGERVRSAAIKRKGSKCDRKEGQFIATLQLYIARVFYTLYGSKKKKLNEKQFLEQKDDDLQQLFITLAIIY